MRGIAAAAVGMTTNDDNRLMKMTLMVAGYGFCVIIIAVGVILVVVVSLATQQFRSQLSVRFLFCFRFDTECCCAVVGDDDGKSIDLVTCILSLVEANRLTAFAMRQLFFVSDGTDDR